MKVLATCISGLQDVAWEHLRHAAGAAKLLEKEEGLLVFETGAPPQQVRALPYLNNVFLVLQQLGQGTVDDALRTLPSSDAWHEPLRRSVTPRERTFRIVLSDENQLVAGDPEALARLRAAVARVAALRDSPRGGDVELWLLRRRSGQVYLCKRISRRNRTDENLRKGELRPELAHLLCLLSEPQPSDVFLDPFAGSGAIPLARAHYPYNMIFAFDLDPANVQLMKARKKEAPERKKSPFIVRAEDARTLARIEDAFIDKIVTDPPWGFFDASVDAADLSRSALAELCRVSKSGALLVVLFGDRELADAMTSEFSDRLQLLARHQILVSGKKAVVCKWRRT